MQDPGSSFPHDRPTCLLSHERRRCNRGRSLDRLGGMRASWCGLRLGPNHGRVGRRRSYTRSLLLIVLDHNLVLRVGREREGKGVKNSRPPALRARTKAAARRQKPFREAPTTDLLDAMASALLAVPKRGRALEGASTLHRSGTQQASGHLQVQQRSAGIRNSCHLAVGTVPLCDSPSYHGQSWSSSGTPPGSPHGTRRPGSRRDVPGSRPPCSRRGRQQQQWSRQGTSSIHEAQWLPRKGSRGCPRLSRVGKDLSIWTSAQTVGKL
jgi:hypothetical protein